MPLTLQRYHQIATDIFGSAAVEANRVRIRHATLPQADVIMNLEWLRETRPELSASRIRSKLLELQVAVGCLLGVQDSPSRTLILPDICKHSALLDHHFQPGGEPLWRPLLAGVSKDYTTGSDLVVALAIYFEGTGVRFHVTPAHLERRGLSEEDAWTQAFVALDKHTADRFSIRWVR